MLFMLAHVIDLLFPPQCVSCNAQVAAHGTLCLPCWQNVRFITDPFCACCGQPFDFALGENALCGECLRERPTFSRARAAFRYDEHSRQLITKLKYADQTQLASIYGTWLARFGKELVAESDIIIPVPLHYWRLVSRRYNQAALLAYALSKQCGLPVSHALKRLRATQPQPGLTRKQRRDNVRGAFMIPQKLTDHVKGKTVLLIDDVMTTSATLEECSRVLMNTGALKVNVLVLARRAG